MTDGAIGPITALDDSLANRIGLERFAAAMLAKLDQKQLQGRGGWNYPDQCSITDLKRMLREHVDKGDHMVGDPVDIANFAMMIWNRQYPNGKY